MKVTNYATTKSGTKHAVIAVACENCGHIMVVKTGKKFIRKPVHLPVVAVVQRLEENLQNITLRVMKILIFERSGHNVTVCHFHPDKKFVFEMAQSNYKRFLEAGVEIYEYEPGFVHGKCYLADGELAMVGSINLDYRSLVHHFENGVWMYRCRCLTDIRMDFEATLEKCIPVDESQIQWPVWRRLMRAVLKVFAPMM
jgi:phosphatidylserine/phosphatidylglycerophosphate/cardiolipin synthase-like enzyme